MQMLISISAGAVVGALGRHFLTTWVTRLAETGFPWATMLVNVLGSLCLGVLVELLALKISLSQEVRAFLVIGVLGSFTTFSTFSFETVLLLQKGQSINALVYVLASVVLSISAFFAGVLCVRAMVV